MVQILDRFRIQAPGVVAVDQGRSFVSSTGPHTNSGGGDMRFAKFATGSSKKIRITKIIMSSDQTARWRITRNPTTTADGEAQTANNRRLGASGNPSNEGILYYGPTVTSEGSLCYDQWVTPNIALAFDMQASPWLLYPGATLLFTFSSGAGANGSLTLEWEEA